MCVTELWPHDQLLKSCDLGGDGGWRGGVCLTRKQGMVWVQVDIIESCGPHTASVLVLLLAAVPPPPHF